MKEFFQNSLPFWKELSNNEKELIINGAKLHLRNAGTILNYGGGKCSGVEIVKSGTERIYVSSPNGREITLYRLLDNDICMMSAACMLNNINFNISLESETDCEIIIISHEIYQRLFDTNNAVKNFTLELVSSKFTDVMWLLEQLVFSNMGSRLAGALLEHSALNGSNILEITHEKIASDLGTAREVVTRLLKQFQLDGIVSLSRGKIEIINEKSLMNMKS